eukprot:COSAG02_NODE_4280_length_5552_cov_6.509628_6_plen_94_part_00
MNSIWPMPTIQLYRGIRIQHCSRNPTTSTTARTVQKLQHGPNLESGHMFARPLHALRFIAYNSVFRSVTDCASDTMEHPRSRSVRRRDVYVLH